VSKVVAAADGIGATAHDQLDDSPALVEMVDRSQFIANSSPYVLLSMDIWSV
jgi:hypothetical protein